MNSRWAIVHTALFPRKDEPIEKGPSATEGPSDPVADLRRTVEVLREQAQRTGVVAHDLQADGIERALATLWPEIEALRAARESWKLVAEAVDGRTGRTPNDIDEAENRVRDAIAGVAP